MLTPEESAELRSLQTKAYGPGGGVLTEADLERLQELERLRLPSVAHPFSSSTASQPPLNAPQAAPVSSHTDPSRADSLPLAQRESPGVETSPPPIAEEVDDTPAARTRRRWPVVVAASVAILAIGLGIGWGIWGWDAEAFALEAAHAEQRAELEAGGYYDSGTVVPVSEQYGVVIWRAERSHGDEICVIATTAKQVQRACTPSEQLQSGAIWSSASITVPEGEEKEGSQLAAALITTPAGELVPFVQIWDQDEAGLESQYSDAELAQLHELEGAGYDGNMLSIIGYDGDRAVWSNWGSSEFCIIAAPDDGLLEACVADAESDLTLAVVVDGIPTDYVVRQSERRGPQLTVVRHEKVTKVEVDPGSGDPIEFTFDDPMIDDNTGE